MKISFGIIVLNGEPFTRYCIRALYPHAYEIIIAEGACEGARNVATPDGHSQDDTLANLREFKRLEDPENKISIVIAEDEGHPDGFWPGEKHEQSQAYAKRATGNYLWQVDIDEFYKDEDIIRIKNILEAGPEITAVSFKQIQFWGGFGYTVDSWYLRRGMEEFHRLFKWGEGYQYKTHRPPTVINEKGEDTRMIKWMGKNETAKLGIFLYHYSFVFPKQVFTKADYYSNSNWLSLNANTWFSMNFMKITKPYRVYIIPDYPSWLERFNGTHPKDVEQLIRDIYERKTIIDERKTEDIENLLYSNNYQLGSLFLKNYEPVDRWIKTGIKKIKVNIRRLRHAFECF
jgi:hypothetical protein